MRNLASLNLSNNKLDRLAFDCFSSNSKLEVIILLLKKQRLDLSHNKIRCDVMFKCLTSLAHQKCLDISQNKCRLKLSRLLLYLEKCNCLEKLYVQQNPQQKSKELAELHDITSDGQLRGFQFREVDTDFSELLKKLKSKWNFGAACMNKRVFSEKSVIDQKRSQSNNILNRDYGLLKKKEFNDNGFEVLGYNKNVESVRKDSQCAYNEPVSEENGIISGMFCCLEDTRTRDNTEMAINLKSNGSLSSNRHESTRSNSVNIINPARRQNSYVNGCGQNSFTKGSKNVSYLPPRSGQFRNRIFDNGYTKNDNPICPIYFQATKNFPDGCSYNQPKSILIKTDEKSSDKKSSTMRSLSSLPKKVLFHDSIESNPITREYQSTPVKSDQKSCLSFGPRPKPPKFPISKKEIPKPSQDQKNDETTKAQTVITKPYYSADTHPLLQCSQTTFSGNFQTNSLSNRHSSSAHTHNSSSCPPMRNFMESNVSSTTEKVPNENSIQKITKKYPFVYDKEKRQYKTYDNQTNSYIAYDIPISKLTQNYLSESPDKKSQQKQISINTNVNFESMNSYKPWVPPKVDRELELLQFDEKIKKRSTSVPTYKSEASITDITVYAEINQDNYQTRNPYSQNDSINDNVVESDHHCKNFEGDAFITPLAIKSQKGGVSEARTRDKTEENFEATKKFDSQGMDLVSPNQKTQKKSDLVSENLGESRKSKQTDKKEYSKLRGTVDKLLKRKPSSSSKKYFSEKNVDNSGNADELNYMDQGAYYTNKV